MKRFVVSRLQGNLPSQDNLKESLERIYGVKVVRTRRADSVIALIPEAAEQLIREQRQDLKLSFDAPVKLAY